MWFRLRPDIRYTDLGYGLLNCLKPFGRATVTRDLEQLWAGPQHTFACLSVRTGFDLLLQALAWPPGSEIVMTALTIPDMASLVAHHQLAPVPLDISSSTLGPDLEELRRCLTSRTKAVVIAHLFGSRVPVEPVLRLLADRPILLIEDCAQAFEGCHAYTGHPAADVAMFSFGPIKTSTALGGALFRVKDPGLLARLQDIESRLPGQERRQFFLRLWKYLLIKLATSPPLWGTIARACQKRGLSYETAITRLARGFGGPQDLITKIRHRPPTPMLALLRRRLRHFDADALQRRQRNGERLSSRLSSAVALVGAAAPHMSYWLFPMLNEKRAQIIPWLRQNGFDASQNHTLGVVPVPERCEIGSNRQAQHLLNELLLAPAGAAMPEPEVERLAACLIKRI
jgi:perosamine synthetase